MIFIFHRVSKAHFYENNAKHLFTHKNLINSAHMYFRVFMLEIWDWIVLKWGSVKFDIRKMLCTFSFGCFRIYRNKSAKIIAINFIRMIVPIKYMRKISAVGLFCPYKFENNQTRMWPTFFRISKLTEPYFKNKRIIVKMYFQT